MLSQHWSEYGIGFAIALALALWAIFHIIGDERRGPASKAIWTVFVLFAPYLGWFCWLLFGPRAPKPLR